ncbi:hypothetical protein ZTR_02486 [Talaromyces verruculosus]|nr:hypothetical protein ZTR_02486 [Talaromyces verruculosus]
MAEIPKTMKGVVIEKTGGTEVLEYKTDLTVPTPSEGQVLIKNGFSGVNFIDTYFRTGFYPLPLPGIMGMEGEGTIVALGGGNTYDLKVGDRVLWFGAMGSYGEYAAVPSLRVHVLPKEIPEGFGAAAAVQGLTALTLIKEAYPVKKDEWVLVHAAAGGCGLWLCQFLREVGAKIIGTASTPEKLELAQKNGAQYLINYAEEDVVAQVKAITGGEGVAVVFDGTGKDQFENDLEVVVRKGTVVSFGNSSGGVPPVPIFKLMAKNVKLLRPTLQNYVFTRDEVEHYVGQLLDFIVSGKGKVHVHKIYPLEDIATVHTDVVSRGTTGKLLLKH